MTHHLSKGGSVPIPDAAAAPVPLLVAFGRRREPAFAHWRIDPCALVVGTQETATAAGLLVHAGAPALPDGGIRYLRNGDEPESTGAARIGVDLAALDTAARVYLAATVVGADGRPGTFGDVLGAHVRLTAHDELARYELDQDASTETAMLFAEIYHRDRSWRFRALGQGFTTGLDGITDRYGGRTETARTR
ncbi:TerD family protein [Actinomadura sp. 21ATH]|uniref:TerD family protein n=1 Tax=Actinomadura sp. 21ATH TaxID=1735444 RepID=UPI0035C056B4